MRQSTATHGSQTPFFFQNQVNLIKIHLSRHFISGIFVFTNYYSNLGSSSIDSSITSITADPTGSKYD